jgi:hypothetical protein
MKIYPQNLILKNIIEIEKKKIRKEKKKEKKYYCNG